MLQHTWCVIPAWGMRLVSERTFNWEQRTNIGANIEQNVTNASVELNIQVQSEVNYMEELFHYEFFFVCFQDTYHARTDRRLLCEALRLHVRGKITVNKAQEWLVLGSIEFH